jgi:ADP-ribosylglycohydrolase
MLQEVVSTGGDADTNASIAGQIAGARLGIDGLPRELINKLPDLAMILEIGSQFASYVESRRTQPFE